jgi:hypothetical protein
MLRPNLCLLDLACWMRRGVKDIAGRVAQSADQAAHSDDSLKFKKRHGLIFSASKLAILSHHGLSIVSLR